MFLLYVGIANHLSSDQMSEVCGSFCFAFGRLVDPSAHRLYLPSRKSVCLPNVHKTLRAPSRVSELTFLCWSEEYHIASLYLPRPQLSLCDRKDHKNLFCYVAVERK